MLKMDFHSLKVNTITGNSGLYTGYNLQYRWTHTANDSYGFGNVNGKSNMITNNKSFTKKDTEEIEIKNDKNLDSND